MVERRRQKRIPWESWVTLQDGTTGRMVSGMLFNFNSTGIYFECDTRFRNGTELVVLVENLPNAVSPGLFKVQVRWIEEIDDAVVMYRYGIGARCVQPLNMQYSRSRFKVIPGGVDAANQSAK